MIYGERTHRSAFCIGTNGSVAPLTRTPFMSGNFNEAWLQELLEDTPAMILANLIFGGTSNSKLFMNVREKLSLCYYCFAVPEAQKGLMVVTAGIQRENAERTKEEILRQWKEVCRGEFTDGALEDARRALINAYRELTDNPSGLESWYTARAMAGITRSPEDEIAMVAALTRDDVIASANKLTPDTFYLMEGTAEHDEEEEPDHAD